MPGPAPKDPKTRRRRNVPAAGEWIVLPQTVYTGDMPKLPSRLVGGSKPLAATVETWESWWSSPMAHMWQKADWNGLLHTIWLVEAFARTSNIDLLKELRLQKDLYGLTPKGRQALRWRIDIADDDGDAEVSPSRWGDLRVVN